MAEATYGYCPVCKRRIRLNLDGTVRHHGACEGAGQSPTEEAGTE